MHLNLARFYRFTALLVAASFLSACAHQTKNVAQAPVAPAPVVVIAHANDNLNAVTWMQNSAEYDALTMQTYRNALRAVELGKSDSTINALPDGEQSSLPANAPLAVITDVDETLVDNTAFNARMIKHPIGPNLPASEAGNEFKKRWFAWSDEAAAKAMPGATEFVQAVDRLGVTIFYITNREDREREATCENLRKLQYPLKDCATQVLTRNDAEGRVKEKGTRRVMVGKTHRVVAMLGDNLGDFLNGIYVSVEVREAIIQKHSARWGAQWFFFANPAYGSWEESIGKRIPAEHKPETIIEREHLLHQAKMDLLDLQQTKTDGHESGFER